MSVISAPRSGHARKLIGMIFKGAPDCGHADFGTGDVANIMDFAFTESRNVCVCPCVSKAKLQVATVDAILYISEKYAARCGHGACGNAKRGVVTS